METGKSRPGHMRKIENPAQRNPRQQGDLDGIFKNVKCWISEVLAHIWQSLLKA
jgi:hypothetical protein